jgi:hypothetical protein
MEVFLIVDNSARKKSVAQEIREIQKQHRLNSKRKNKHRIPYFKTPKEKWEFWLERRPNDTWVIGTNIFQYVKLLAARCQRFGWEIVKGTTRNTYYFTVPLTEVSVDLKIFEQTATEGRKRWGQELGRKYGADALRKYQAQRKKRSIVRQIINDGLEVSPD